MTFRFREGDSVRLKEDRPTLGLKAGDTGIVWALYSLDSPAYEVTFRNDDGQALDMTMTEDELLPVTAFQVTLSISGKQTRAA